MNAHPLLALLTTRPKATRGKSVLFVFALVLLGWSSAWAQPTISSISPLNGIPGGTVTITGTNFNTTVANNAVFFGGVRGTVTAATATQLTVTIPSGARSGGIDVVNTATFRQVRSIAYFTVRYAGGTFGTSSLAAPVSFSLGASSAPSKLDLADMDGDGKLDVVASRTNLSTGILRNTSSGATTSFAAVAALNTRTGVQSFTVHDFNSDGKLDLMESYVPAAANINLYVTPNSSVSGTISGGTPVTSGGINGGSSMRGTAALDISVPVDGKPDALWVFETSGGVNNSYVYANVNTGNAGTTSFGTNAVVLNSAGFKRMWDVAAADFDGDGLNDLASYETGSGGVNNLYIARNTPTGGLVPAGVVSIALNTASPQAGRILLTDADSDGKPDLVLLVGNSALRVFRNTSTSGSISFANAGDFGAAIANKTYFTTGDVTGDGKPDLVIACNATTGSVVVLPNTTSGTTVSYGSAISFDGAAATDVAVGDVNGDGRPDIVTACNSTNQAQVYINNNAAAAPTITSFTPASGPVGTSVTITGTNFTGATAVTFGAGNTAAQSFAVNSATQITATVASGTSTGVIRVTTPGGTVSSATNFTIAAAAPTISSFTPASGAAGTSVTITGTNFTGATAVTFGAGNTAAQTFTVNSATQITATVAAGTSTGVIRVTTPGGTVSSATNFTITAAAPTISSVTGPVVGAPQFIVTGGLITINGSNFTGASSVVVGAGLTPVQSFTVVSATQITARVAAATTLGSGAVRVTTGGGTATSSNYTIISGQPVINSFSPTSGNAGTTVVINGTNLYIDNGAPNPTVTIGANNTPATVLGYVGNDLSVSVGSGTVSGPITVTTTYGTVTSAGSFSVASAQPTITSVDYLAAGINAPIVITGTNLAGANCFINGLPLTVQSNTATSITVQAPSFAWSGLLSVTTTGGTVQAGYFTHLTASNVLYHCAGNVLTLTGPAGASSYQWQVDAGSGFVNVANDANYSGAATRTLRVSGAPSSWTGRRYRVVINGGTAQTPVTLRFVSFVKTNLPWSNVNSWTCGNIPDQYTDVIVDDVTIACDINTTVRSVTITNGGRINVAAGVQLIIRP